MLVVGFGNTAADVTGLLADVAEKVYVSHRHGAIVVSLELGRYIPLLSVTANHVPPAAAMG